MSNKSATVFNWLSVIYKDVELSDIQKDIAIADVCVDSREVKQGSAFIAIKGVGRHGIEFVNAALENGAACVLIDSNDIARLPTLSGLDSDKVIAVKALDNHLSKLLKGFYPGVADIKKVAVTGTNGKTTVSQLIAQLAVLCDMPTGVIGTMGAGVFRLNNDKTIFDACWGTANTTPHLAVNYRLLNKMQAAGSLLATMEVSSIGIEQQRVQQLDFDVAVMTNLTQDHLDYHGDMASYGAAKKRLFLDNPNAAMVLNIDDETALGWYQQWAYHAEQNHHLIAVGKYNKQNNFARFLCYDQVQSKNNGFEFILKSHLGDFRVSLPLFGQFNITNTLSALAALVALGMDIKQLVSQMAHLVAVDGRMEQFDYCGSGDGQSVQVKVIVDYAHTPDALNQALSSLRQHSGSKLWCIFGCGGDRDKQKRPLMAKAAEQWADNIVVTNDNPRHEVPKDIAADICAGFGANAQYKVELNRKQAIASTLAQASNDDIVLIAGKGHETYQVFGDDVIEYDEREFVRRCCVNSVNTMNEVVTS